MTPSKTLGHRRCGEEHVAVEVVWDVEPPCRKTLTLSDSSPRKVSAIKTMEEEDVEVVVEGVETTTTRAEAVDEVTTKAEVGVEEEITQEAVGVVTRATEEEEETTMVEVAAIKDAGETASNSRLVEAEMEAEIRMAEIAEELVEVIQKCSDSAPLPTHNHWSSFG